MKRLADLTKVQLETLRSSKNSKKLTEMARNEDVQLTPAEIGHIFASKTEACEENHNSESLCNGNNYAKAIAPYGRSCTHNLQVKFTSVSGVPLTDLRWCGVEHDNDCPFLEHDNSIWYCKFVSNE